MADIHLYNTLTREKELFEPLDKHRIGVYVCGPTVYDCIHIGNARPVVVFDVLVRLLRYGYGNEAVHYVRNITDVDDKIIARAAELDISISELTERATHSFINDYLALGTIPPNVEPKATKHIPEMIAMIEKLITKGQAYTSDGHVLFDIRSMENYGQLSGRSLDEMLAGARVEVVSFKRDAGDFVLWKPSSNDIIGWDSPWGRGRPGWHIECSAMSAKHLGETFDIHGGGLDLIFPHHENEIAQSCSAHGNQVMARTWMHNGYVTVNGEKMAKSLGNFITVNDALMHYHGEVCRYALLTAHYRTPLDFSWEKMDEAKSALDTLYRATHNAASDGMIDEEVLAALSDDLTTPKALARLHAMAKMANKGDANMAANLKASAAMMGLLQVDFDDWFKEANTSDKNADENFEDEINEAIIARQTAKEGKDFTEADRIRNALAEKGIILEDTPQGTVWRRK